MSLKIVKFDLENELNNVKCELSTVSQQVLLLESEKQTVLDILDFVHGNEIMEEVLS